MTAGQKTWLRKRLREDEEERKEDAGRVRELVEWHGPARDGLDQGRTIRVPVSDTRAPKTRALVYRVIASLAGVLLLLFVVFLVWYWQSRGW